MTRQPEPGNLSAVAALVRRADPDRFFCALFAPPAQREAVLLLAAVNHELARAREAVSLPPLALIRLQWWREVADGARRAHEVAGPLGAALDAGLVGAAAIHAMVDAREAEADDVPDFAAWEALVRGTAGGLAVAQAGVLGADPASVARIGELAAGYGAAGQLRNLETLARRGRCLLPLDLLAEAGLTPEEVVFDPRDARLAPVRARIAAWALGRLDAGRGRFGRDVVAAALPGVLARRDLRRLARPVGPRGLGDRAAVLLAYLARRV